MRFVKKYSVLRAFLITSCVLLILFIGGFTIFLSFATTQNARELVSAHAIVAFTGGPQRIEKAVELLSEGKAKRLLISGVNTETSRRDLRRRLPQYARFFQCCIDLGHVAMNTIGNASETKNWMQKKGFSSLIVVTASYHMPRSLVELRSAMPNIKLIPYAVHSKHINLNSIWTHPDALWLLFKEYVKTLPAIIRYCFSKII